MNNNNNNKNKNNNSDDDDDDEYYAHNDLVKDVWVQKHYQVCHNHSLLIDFLELYITAHSSTFLDELFYFLLS